MEECLFKLPSQKMKRNSRDVASSRVESEKNNGSDFNKFDENDIQDHDVFYA